MQTYIEPSINIHKDWINNLGNTEGLIEYIPEHALYKPSARQQIVIDATRQVLEDFEKRGVYPYNSAVDPKVAELLGVDINSDICKSSKTFNVEGGIFGYDVYLARKWIETQNNMAKNLKAIQEHGFYKGQKLGKIKEQWSKAMLNCVIDDIFLPFGSLNITFTRGGRRYAQNIYASYIVTMLENTKAAKAKA